MNLFTPWLTFGHARGSSTGTGSTCALGRLGQCKFRFPRLANSASSFRFVPLLICGICLLLASGGCATRPAQTPPLPPKPAMAMARTRAAVSAPSVLPAGLTIKPFLMVDVTSDLPAGRYRLEKSSDLTNWTQVAAFETNQFTHTELRLVGGQGFWRAGKRVFIAWDASPASNVTNYTLWRGNQPEVWNQSRKLGLALTAELTAQDLQRERFFVVRCEDSEGDESDPSNEIRVTPTP